MNICKALKPDIAIIQRSVKPEDIARKAEFAAAIGWEYLAGMHLNDTKGGCGSHLDRHAPVGDGALGVETFRRIVTDPRIGSIPLILETPEPDRWADEIRLLRRMAAE